MLYIIIGLFLIVITIFLLQDENYKGCIMYVLCCGLVLLFVCVKSYYERPKYERVSKITTSNKFALEYSHTRYSCPSGGSYYCVIKNDSLEKPMRQDICINCGQIFSKHNYIKTHEEIMMDEAIRNAFLETPAE